MSAKDRDLEADFQNADPSLSIYVDQLITDSKEDLYEDILMVEERYIQSSAINQGGMKKILKTTDALTDRPVAKATLIDFEDSKKVEGFLKEARLTAALEHPNIMPVYDIGVDETEGPFFTMKLVGGQNLGDIIKSLSKDAGEPPKYSLLDLMEIFLKVCDAVAYAHSRAVVHLDLKPDNIQVGDYGEVLVCDWGIAKVLEEAEDITESVVDLDPYIYNGLTLDGEIKGTPGFMAPEQINTEFGSKNRQTDIYALGGILYSLLCYKAPYKSETLESVLKETLEGSLKPPSERISNEVTIPSSLEAVAIKALQIKPEDRYQSVSEIKNEINKWMRGFATEAEDAGFLKSFFLLLKRHQAVSVLLFILIVSGVFAVSKIKENERVARENEQEAKRALDLYLAAQQEKGEINKFSLENVLSMNKVLLDRYEYDKAIVDLNQSLQFQPDNEMLNLLKGKLHFYRQEYAEAINAFDKSGSKKESEVFSLMYKLSQEYAAKKEISENDLASLMLQFDGIDRKMLFIYQAKKYWFDLKQPFKEYLAEHPNLEQHLEFCRLMILGDIPEQPVSDFRFKYNFAEEGINIDMSNNVGLPLETNYLNHLPLNKLDVSNSDFHKYYTFQHPYLKYLDIRNTKFKRVRDSILTSRNIGNNKLTLILTKSQSENTRMQYEDWKIPHWYKFKFIVKE